MLELLWTIPALPFVGCLVLILLGSRLSKKTTAIIGAGSVGASALIMVVLGLRFIIAPPEGDKYTQTLWTWIDVGNFSPSVSLHLDALSLTMMFVITFVGFLIHLYSTEYMIDDEGYSRFFAYMNLFVGSMLMLVLGEDLLLLLLGWEGVGLCSYLLIGFWYRNPDNGYAARKAFIVTRVGDTAMMVGLFILFSSFGTLDIQELLRLAPDRWSIGTEQALIVAALLFLGAVGKSAQLPLQTWLPDAMAGPTPVSALIHAATMVTAGVYLIARTHVIFELAPAIMTVVAVVGAATLLLAGMSALTQRDIKRVLAYSTISQIGYMFLALGVGAWSAAMFHFMTHAFFKALLFLGAGAVILALHHEQNMFKMGGLRRELPITFWTFLVASASLTALPLVSAGFYSKELILWKAWSSEAGSPWLWGAGVVGAFVTSVYTFRMVFLTFFGEPKGEVGHKPGRRIRVVLIVLAAFSALAGFIELPHTMGHVTVFSDFLRTAVSEAAELEAAMGAELMLQLVASVVALSGVYVAYLLYIRSPQFAERLSETAAGSALHRFLFSGWGFDWLYDRVFVAPIVWLSRINKGDVIDRLYDGIVAFSRVSHRVLSMTQTGQIRWYATGIALGTAIILTIAVFL